MIQPLHDRILIRRIAEPNGSKLIIPDMAKGESHKAKVIAVGPGRMVEGVNGGLVRRPVEVEPGDVVYFCSSDEHPNLPDGCVMIQEADICGVMARITQ